MSNKPARTATAFLKQLKAATWCCDFCGRTYGQPRPGCSTYHEGKCDVCGEIKAVTETRDYGYLQLGITNLQTKKAN